MNDDNLTDDPLVPEDDVDELDDDGVIIPKKIPIIDPEEDHESLDALADEEEEEIDSDQDEVDSF
ncbi:MAG: hypothetical protein AAB660_02080 [Patescibacteria group bacterium]